MNVFIIPSWYPSETHPTTGIFIKEQAELMARHRPDWNVGLSLWGSHESKLWIRPWRPLDAFIRVCSHFPIKTSERVLDSGCVTFFHPAFTWTRRIMAGNIKGIIKANQYNLERFQAHFGRPDVLIAHAAHPAGYVAWYLSKTFRIPFIIIEHMTPFPLPSYKHDLKKWIIPPLVQANKVLSVSKSQAEALAGCSVQSDVSYNFIDEDFFQPVHAEPNKHITLFALGRLEPQKGFDLLLKGLTKVSENWILRIGGDGRQKNQLRWLAKKLKLTGRIEWLGELPRETVKSELQSCDFFVLPSRFESFGVVLIEAMACGKPVVATTCGPTSEIITEDAGLLCEASPDSLAAAISIMCRRFHTYQPERIREHFLSNFSANIGVDRMEKILSAVIDSPKETS